MNTFSNPLEEIFAALSVVQQLINGLIRPIFLECAGAPDVLACLPSTITMGVIVGIIGISLFLWLSGYRLMFILLPLTSFFTITMYLYFTYGAFSPTSIGIGFALFLTISFFLERYRSIFWIVGITSITIRLIALILGVPPLIGILTGLVIGGFLCRFKQLRKWLDQAIILLTVLVTTLIGGLNLLIIGLCGLIIIGQELTKPLWGTNENYLVTGIIILVVAGLVFSGRLFVWGGMFIVIGGMLQLSQLIGKDWRPNKIKSTTGELQAPVIPDLTLEDKVDYVAVIGVCLIFFIQAFPVVDTKTTRSSPKNETPQDLLSLVADYQVFSGQLLHPWYSYPWDDTAVQKREFRLISSSMQSNFYTCPARDCQTLFNGISLEFYTVTPAVSDSRDGITGTGNYLGDVEGESINGSTLWYAFYVGGWDIVYIPADSIQIIAR